MKKKMAATILLALILGTGCASIARVFVSGIKRESEDLTIEVVDAVVERKLGQLAVKYAPHAASAVLGTGLLTLLAKYGILKKKSVTLEEKLNV